MVRRAVPRRACLSPKAREDRSGRRLSRLAGPAVGDAPVQRKGPIQNDKRGHGRRGSFDDEQAARLCCPARAGPRPRGARALSGGSSRETLKGPWRTPSPSSSAPSDRTPLELTASNVATRLPLPGRRRRPVMMALDLELVATRTSLRWGIGVKFERPAEDRSVPISPQPRVGLGLVEKGDALVLARAARRTRSGGASPGRLCNGDCAGEKYLARSAFDAAAKQLQAERARAPDAHVGFGRF